MFWKWGIALLGCVAALGWIASPRRRGRFTVPLVICAIALTVFATANSLGNWAIELYRVLAGAAALQTFCVVAEPLFERRRVPRLVNEALLAFGYLALLIFLLSKLGVNVVGLVTTSAIVTAAIGFGMQDTLANLASGFVLQIERTIHVGDWVRTPVGTGRVETVRLRHTVLETPFGDRLLVPNLQLTKEGVTMLGARQRLQIPLRVQYGPSPSMVENAVREALCASPLLYVAADPAPNCILTGFETDHTLYALILFVDRLGYEPVAASDALTRAYFALSRINAKPAGFTQAVQFQRPHAHLEEDKLRSRHLNLLKTVDVFRSLEPVELEELAAAVQNCSFAAGELIIEQGDHDDDLFIVETGDVDVLVSAHPEAAETRRLATLRTGEFFGELSLFTGEPRSASVMASSEVCCLRLQKQDVMPLLKKRPAIAREISEILAERQLSLGQVRDRLRGEAEESQVEIAEGFLPRILGYFGIRATKSAASS